MNRSPWENEIFAKESLAHIDSKFLPGTKQEIDFIEAKLNLQQGARIIDLGCGAGRHSIELAKRGYSVCGVDISKEMLDAARERAKESNTDVTFVQRDLLELGEHFRRDPGAFDAAICICESGFGVLGQQEDLNLLKDIYGLLKYKSCLVLTTYNCIKKYRGERILNKSFNFLEGTSHWTVPDDWHGNEKLAENQRVYISSEVSLMFRLAGFTDIQVLGCKPGEFCGQDLQPDDTEMMVIGRKNG